MLFFVFASAFTIFIKLIFSLYRYVPPITTSSDGHGGSVALPESPDAIEEEIKKQESLLAGNGIESLSIFGCICTTKSSCLLVIDLFWPRMFLSGDACYSCCVVPKMSHGSALD